MVSTDDVNLMGDHMKIMKPKKEDEDQDQDEDKNRSAIDASEEICLEADMEKTKCS